MFGIVTHIQQERNLRERERERERENSLLSLLSRARKAFNVG